MNIIYVIAAAVILSVASPPLASAQNAQQLFQQALSKERADGNLDEAIQLYRRVITEAGADRALASRALLQLGRCYEKLGQSGARESYERLLRDYADQAPVAAEAKSRLAAMERAAAPPRALMTIRTLPLMGHAGNLQSMSPDGTRALVGDYIGGQNLAIFDITSKQSRLVTSFDWTEPWVYGGIWSADASQIAFMQSGWKGDSIAELRVADLAGEPRTIFRHLPGASLMPAAWAPDGMSVLVTLSQADRTTAIGFVSIGDGRFTPLKSFGPSAQPDPAISPDGRLVAFVDRTAGPGELHVISVDGKEGFRVTDHPADDREPVWSPDGRHIAFISNRFGADALWALAIDGRAPRGEPFKIRDGMHGTQLIEWSPRGIVATQRVQSADLYTIAADAGAARTTGAPQALPYLRTGRNHSPVWSPDGASLAFVSSPASDSRTRFIVVLPKAGRPREFQMPYPNRPSDLRWFGNGRGLGFSGVDDKGEPVVLHLSLDTGEWKTAPLPVTSWTRIEWNHDGTAFYYARQSFAEPNGGIFERRFDGQGERRVYAISGSTSMSAHEFSPDRKWLAFLQRGVTGDIQKDEVVIVNIVTGESRSLAAMTSSTRAEGGRVNLSGWLPDGRVLVQRKASADAVTEWLLYPVDGRAPREASIGIPTAPGTAGIPPVTPTGKWSPDGSTIVFVKRGFSGGSFIIENPLAERSPAEANGRAGRR